MASFGRKSQWAVLALLALVAVVLAAGTARNLLHVEEMQEPVSAAAVAPAAPQAGGLPYGLYPVWTSVRLPTTPASGTPLPPPSMSAVHISPGYLLGVVEGMDGICADYGLDPTVRVLDRGTWREGKFVDCDEGDMDYRDPGTQLALIRVDVSGEPLKAAPSDGGMATLVTVVMVQGGLDVTEQRDLNMCGGNVDQVEVLNGVRHCYQRPVRGLTGGVMLDHQNRLVGMQVMPEGYKASYGPGLTTMRGFIARFNETWGKHQQVKPAL